MAQLSYPELLAAEAAARTRRRHPIRLIAIFMACFFAMHFGWESARGTAVERIVIDRVTVEPAAWLINHILPDQQVLAEGHKLVSDKGSINVLNGCEGLETLFLLLAAILAYPLAWRFRLPGLLAGSLLVYALNQGRLVALWYAWIHDPLLFGPLHGIILPLVMIAATLFGFLAYLRYLEPGHAITRG